MTLKLNLEDSRINKDEIEALSDKLAAAKEKLYSGMEDFTGWVNLPLEFDQVELSKIKATAKDIRSKCDAFVVIGIGGSYLGARAAIEMLVEETSGPKIYFAGQNISATYHGRLLKELEDKEICLCIISKSGTTIEPAIAFSLLKNMMIEKYGEKETAKRIIAITDKEKGIIREEADREGYESFVVPDDIGGRYSVLTPVGLLPIAVAGIDIEAMLKGAKDMMGQEKIAEQYAATRVLLKDQGKKIEIYESYEPDLFYFSEWLKQLFGESEGKEGKGIFPASLQFSTDLHSMGQFLQEGNQIFFETVLNVEKPTEDIKLPLNAGENLAGINMNDVNEAAILGVMEAHRKALIPMVKIDIPALNSYYFGQMVYFFKMACALSGYLISVNPFDQPGVEDYKTEMKNVLNKLK